MFIINKNVQVKAYEIEQKLKNSRVTYANWFSIKH